MSRKHIYELITTVSILLILCISVGYAAISTNLKVTGTAVSKSASWNIYFDNVQVDSKSVTADAPTISDDKLAVTFSAKLNKLGDKYAFTVDIKNDGSLDGIVNVVNLTELSETQQKYMDLQVGYVGGTPINKNDLLASGETLTLEFIAKYKKDANLSDLPKTEEKIEITLELEYIQDKDDEGIPVISTLSRTKFKSFAETNTPTEIIFTNTGASTGTDVSSAQDGSILAWMDGTTMYVSRSEKGRYVYFSSTSYQLFSSGSNDGWQSNITYIDLSKCNTINTTNMDSMFYGCTKLTTLDLSMFNTSNVKYLGGMFYSCNSLTSLDLSNFDTCNVIQMQMMFQNCDSLTSLDLSNFDTSNVTAMNKMFDNCIELITIDISSFDTSKVTTMNAMFGSCQNLTSLDLTNFNTSSLNDASSMFWGCSSLTSLDLSSFNTSEVTTMQAMFQQCSNLISLNLSSFNTSNVINMASMFNACSSLVSLNLSSFDTSKVTDMYNMFSVCSSLTTLDISNFNTSNVTNMNWFMSDCTSLKTLTIPSTNGNGISNTTNTIYGSTTSTSFTLTLTGRTVTLK